MTLMLITEYERTALNYNWRVETVLRDFRYAVRSLRKAPGFCVAAVCALAMGIGANTAIFSVMDQLLLKPLHYPDPSRIVLFFTTTPQGPYYGASAAQYNIWKKQTSLFQNIAAYEYRGSDLTVTDGALPEQVHLIHVTADYFPLLGARFIQGRGFSNAEDTPNGGHFAVLSYGFWQRRFGGRATAGKTLDLSGLAYEIVGVLGSGFDTLLDASPEVFLPFQIDANSADHAHYFNVVGRLRVGTTLPVAISRLQPAASEFRRKFPNIAGPKDGFAVQPFQDALVMEARRPLFMLAGAVVFVLLIACANVANLLLMRATGRKREMAIRAAIGASASRIVRQLLTESVALSLFGGALGLILGAAGIRALLAINAGNIPLLQRGLAVSVDWRIVSFTLVLSFVTGVLFGLIPAFDIARVDFGASLKEGGARSGASPRQARIRSFLVATEVALAVVLVIGAGLLMRSLIQMRNIRRGVDTRHVLTLRMPLGGSPFKTGAEVGRLIREASRQINELPGVEMAAAAYDLPLSGVFGIPFQIVGRSATGERYDGRGWLAVSPGYFGVFRIPLVRGRAFSDRDDRQSEPVALISQTMAKRFWPRGDAVGHRLLLGQGYGPEFTEPAREIVGVVGDVLDFGSKAPQSVVYVPVAQVADGITTLMTRASSLAWVVRARGEPQTIVAPVTGSLRISSGGLPVTNIRSMKEVVADSTAEASFQTSLLTIFGAVAVFMATIGIYGLIAHMLEQRTAEIGIRIALGADARSVRIMLVSEGMRWAFLGISVGAAAALGLSRFLANLLFGVRAWDPVTFTVTSLSLAIVLLFAVWLPARRVIRIDPLTALRHE